MSENAVNAASQGKFLIRRDWVYPADLTGRFRTWRSWVGAALIAFFVVTPWTAGGASCCSGPSSPLTTPGPWP